MADTKISELDSASELAGSEILPVVQSGTTVKATVNQILAGVPSSSTTILADDTYAQADGPASYPLGISIMRATTWMPNSYRGLIVTYIPETPVAGYGPIQTIYPDGSAGDVGSTPDPLVRRGNADGTGWDSAFFVAPSTHTHTESEVTDLQDYITAAEANAAYDESGAADAAQSAAEATAAGALTTHQSSSDHDGRYYTESEVDTLLSTHAHAITTLPTYVGLTIVETATGVWSSDAPARTEGEYPVEFIGWTDPADPTDGITTPARINDTDIWTEVDPPV